MLHQYAHIKSLKSQPRESQRGKEGKTNFCFVSSSWKDRCILKLSEVCRPSEGVGGSDCHRGSVLGGAEGKI